MLVQTAIPSSPSSINSTLIQLSDNNHLCKCTHSQHTHTYSNFSLSLIHTFSYTDDPQVVTSTAPCHNTVGVPTSGTVAISCTSSSTGAKIQRSNSLCASSSSALSSLQQQQPHRPSVHTVHNRPAHVKKARPMSFHSELFPSVSAYELFQSHKTDASFPFSSTATTTLSHTRPSSMQFSSHTYTSPSVMNPTRPIIHSNISVPETGESPSPVEKDSATLVTSASTASISTTTAGHSVMLNDTTCPNSRIPSDSSINKIPHHLHHDSRRLYLHKQSSEPVSSQVTRSGFRRSLYESASHPELDLSRLRKVDRSERRDDNLPARIKYSSKISLLTSPSRDRIDTLSKHFVSSISPELKSSYPQWDPITKSIQKIISNMAPLFNITEHNLQALTSLVSSADIAPNFSRRLSCISESIEYEHCDTPLAVKMDEPARGYVTLVFEASLKHNARSKGESALLKVS